jgi:hypothetical protein
MTNNFEIILFDLFDVGRSVDLDRVRQLTASSTETAPVTGRDTPESLDLPHPVMVPLDRMGPSELSATGAASADGPVFTNLALQARVFEEGVVSMMLRLELRCELDQLHLLRNRLLPLAEGAMTSDEFMRQRFHELRLRIAKAITSGQYIFDDLESEGYRVYALTDPVGDPAVFVKEHRDYLAAFLLGEDPSVNLHESQVQITLGHPFSFRGDDLVIFDMDRCFIIDSRRDYEDLLLITEHANYQMLELRTLDKLLDRRLDVAEREAAKLLRRKRFRMSSAGFKLSDLQPLRLDALFILNGLENSSKIVGDFYLCQIYDHLCGLFNTAGWKSNIERSLETLQDIYSMAKGESNEQTLLFLEAVVVLLIAVEVVIFLIAGK